MTSTEQKDQVPSEAARVQRRLQLRMDDLKYSQQRLAREGDSLSRKAQYIRTTVVVLGVVVVLKAGLEQLMLTYQFAPGFKMSLDMLMFVVGALISLLTALEGVRKYGEQGSAMRELSQRSFSMTRVYMSRIGSAKDTLRQLNDIDAEMNNQLDQLYKDAEKQGIDLSLGNPVNYAMLEAG
jgi:hypothetical protein